MVARTASNHSLEAEFYQKLGRLHAWDSQRWSPLPTWTQFYLELGTILGLRPSGNNCLVIPLAVPSRAFVAPLVAAGCVLARATLHHSTNGNHQHIERLCQLEPGTPVTVREERRRRKGVFKGVKEKTSLGGPYFAVQVDRGSTNTTEYFLFDYANQIQPLEETEIKLPKTQKGYTRREVPALITGLLGEAATNFTCETHLDCVLIGQISGIKDEITEQKIALRSGERGYQEGLISDILRPKRLLRNHSSIRSRLLPSRKRRAETFAQTLSPHLVILDGSLSYLNQRHVWQGSSMAIILDRTEPQFEAAVDQVNKEYTRRLDQKLGIDIPRVPAGVETMPFEVNA